MAYDSTWKALIQGESGDGTMSAIDFEMTPQRQPDQKGDRLKLAMTGKFLPHGATEPSLPRSLRAQAGVE